MATKWFVQKDEGVHGPLSEDEVKSRLASGQLTSMHMIWCRGLESWMRLESWQQQLPHLATITHAEPEPETWHYASGGKSFGPFEKVQLVHELKNLESPADVMVWKKGMKEWAPLFEFHDLLTDIGVNKRQFPRADIQGRAVLKTNEQTLIAQLVTISEGGCGLVIDPGLLVPGQPFQLEMQSPAWPSPIHAKAECRYISESFAGVKFTHLSSEAKGSIISFVKQSQTRFVLKAA